MSLRLLLAAGAGLACAPAAHAATRSATPATLPAVLASATQGDVIVLAAGSYGDVTLPQRTNTGGIRVDARLATLRSLIIRKTTGWSWQGGTIEGDLPPVQYFDVVIDAASRIELTGVTLKGSMIGVTVTRGSSDITLRNNIATGLQSDGFNIAGARRVVINANTCSNFKPLMPVYDIAGVLLKDGSHTDCIQLWSTTDHPTTDVTITNNRMTGYMQGIGQYATWGPVRNVRVANNIVQVSTWNGISFSQAQGLDVRGNRVSTLAGSRALHFPFQPIRSWIYAKGANLVACGNVVTDLPKGYGTGPC